jgi:hypothetical protein
LQKKAVLETDQKLQPWFSLVLWVFGSEKVHPAGRQFTEMPDQVEETNNEIWQVSQIQEICQQK